jgi:hypothetical protein
MKKIASLQSCLYLVGGTTRFCGIAPLLLCLLLTAPANAAGTLPDRTKHVAPIPAEPADPLPTSPRMTVEAERLVDDAAAPPAEAQSGNTVNDARLGSSDQQPSERQIERQAPLQAESLAHRTCEGLKDRIVDCLDAVARMTRFVEKMRSTPSAANEIADEVCAGSKRAGCAGLVAKMADWLKATESPVKNP